MSAQVTRVSVPDDQNHLLAFWDHLSEAEQKSLHVQLESVDFPLMKSLFAGGEEAKDWSSVAEQAESPAAFRLNAAKNAFSKEQAIQAGNEAIAAGKVAAIMVAGGQGSRLGFDKPKGMYPIGPLSHRTLFQFHVEQIRAIAKRFDVSLPLLLMTSPATNADTAEFFAENGRFGLPESDFHQFCQGTMPAVDRASGKLLLASKGQLFASPDGHGGTLAALENSGLLQKMKDQGIEHLFYFQVDNPIVEICQPEFIGYHVLSKSELSTQVVCKADPLEKVGNVVKVGDQTTIIEYSDLPDDLADRRDADGQPIFWAGNIAVHVFDLAFLERAAKNSETLPFHRAIKKVPFVDGEGTTITPTEPNAIKFERFIFDLLPWAKNPVVVEVDAEEVFAPLKNASGAPKDTPESTRAAIVAKHRRMLEQAGCTVQDGVSVEVNPLFALDASDLSEKISDALHVSSDQYFEA